LVDRNPTLDDDARTKEEEEEEEEGDDDIETSLWRRNAPEVEVNNT